MLFCRFPVLQKSVTEKNPLSAPHECWQNHSNSGQVPPLEGFKPLSWISHTQIPNFEFPLPGNNISANLEEGIMPTFFSEMKSCISHSKGAEVSAKPETSSSIFIYIYFSGLDPPIQDQILGKHQALLCMDLFCCWCRGRLSLWSQALLQHLLPGCLMASQTSPVWILDIYPGQEDCPKSFSLLEANSWAGFPSWGTSNLISVEN